MNGIAPSNPGYLFDSADLARASKISDAALGTLIAPYMGAGGYAQTPDVTALLAAMLRNVSIKATRYNITPFNVGGGKMQQILGENPSRTALIIGLNDINGNPPGVGVAFDATQFLQTDIDDSINLRSMTILNEVGIFSFIVAPTNPITLLCNGDSETRVRGIIMEGV